MLVRLRLRVRVLGVDEVLHAAQVEESKRTEGGRAPWEGLGLGVRARARVGGSRTSRRRLCALGRVGTRVRARARVRGSRRSRRRPCGYVTKSCAV